MAAGSMNDSGNCIPAGSEVPLNVRGLSCAALLIVETAGCSGDAVFSSFPSGADIEIAPMQSNICPRDCMSVSEGQQLSPLMVLTIEGFEDGGPSGQLVPGTYLSGQPGPTTTALLVTFWQIGGLCDNTNGPFDVTGTVTVTHVPTASGDRLEGSFKIVDGGSSDFNGGTFSARPCG
jgi:hypothetical protein